MTTNKGPLSQYLKSWPIDGGSFDDLIKSAEKDEFATFVWLARVLIDDSLKCLSEKWARHGWIHTHSASLLAAVDQWLIILAQQGCGTTGHNMHGYALCNRH